MYKWHDTFCRSIVINNIVFANIVIENYGNVQKMGMKNKSGQIFPIFGILCVVHVTSQDDTDARIKKEIEYGMTTFSII